ncbi:TPA: hypothetical protein JBK46_12720 [Legionella pneumophila]|nr:hypothetical protein D7226_01835 [Legionella pneumophila]HAT8821392.1 hypothetical protein [Legionella pneumophila subsp. pneumophila]RYX22391.1 hypothetical protein D7267_11775 [Legionella pneumophila]RYX28396.1 hypothetical protein D8B28_09180 [Legionella pneumophila]RYX35241.1 hypothetical protein D7271_04165 [Legionella pneumophila]
MLGRYVNFIMDCFLCSICRWCMMRRHFIIIVLGIFQFGCIPLAEHHNKISPATMHEEYHDINFSNLYEKNRSFPALETGIYAILDGILISSSQDTHLGKKQSKLLEEYVRQNRLFCQKGFDQEWMNQLKQNLDRLEKTENNRIASAVNKKMQALFAERQCNTW